MDKLPFAFQWHITETCDQRCKHCYIFEGKNIESKKDLDLNTLEVILNDIVKSCEKLDRTPSIYITGGDPLLYPKVWEFFRLLHDRNISFIVLGNPFHLTPDVITRLEDCGCTGYQMSLDGLRRTHDEIRKPGSYDATIRALKLFEKSSINTGIMATVSKTNIEDIPKLVDVVVENKVDFFGFARYCPNPEDFDLMFSPEEYRVFLGKMWAKYEEYVESDTEFILKDHLWTLFLYEKGLFDPNEFDNPDDLILDGCHCGISNLSILSTGEVYACRRSYTPIGWVPQMSIFDIITGNAYDEYCQYDKFEHCSNCELKNFCRGCPSVAKCFTGNFYAKDPQCWKKFG